MYKTNNTCAFCGKYSGKYELCNECYQMAKDETIIKNDKNIWIKNIKKGIEYKFYDKNKKYYLKENILNEYELNFFNTVRNSLSEKYIIIPQVNLQSIIETDTNTRNDELFRNIDFVIYHTKNFLPFLAIELNGQQHYTNTYWQERDKSVKTILEKAELPLLTIDIKTLKQKSKNEINILIKKVVKYLNPNIFQKLFGKTNNRMDLNWTKEYL